MEPNTAQQERDEFVLGALEHNDDLREYQRESITREVVRIAEDCGGVTILRNDGQQGVRALHADASARLTQLRACRDAMNARIREVVEEERILGLAVARFDRLAADTTTTTEPEPDLFLEHGYPEGTDDAPLA